LFNSRGLVSRWDEATKQNSNNSFQWRSLSTQTLRNPDGDVLEGCEGAGLG